MYDKPAAVPVLAWVQHVSWLWPRKNKKRRYPKMSERDRDFNKGSMTDICIKIASLLLGRAVDSITLGTTSSISSRTAGLNHSGFSGMESTCRKHETETSVTCKSHTQ